MARNEIIPYNPKLKAYARELRRQSTLSEIILWKGIKSRVLGIQFHRQVPILNFIVDFYCHELKLAIEIDGNSHIGKESYDLYRQEAIENYGVTFIRFTNKEIGKEMFSVSLALEDIIMKLKPN